MEERSAHNRYRQSPVYQGSKIVFPNSSVCLNLSMISGMMQHLDFIQNLSVQFLSSKARFNRHAKDQICFMEKGNHSIHRSRRLQGKAGPYTALTNPAQKRADGVINFGMNGNAVRSGIQEGFQRSG